MPYPYISNCMLPQWKLLHYLKSSVTGLCFELSSVWCCVNQWDAICWGKSTANQMCWGWMEDVLPWINLYGCFCSTPSKWIYLEGILFFSKQEVFPCDYYSLRQPERAENRERKLDVYWKDLILVQKGCQWVVQGQRLRDWALKGFLKMIPAFIILKM